MTIQPNSNMNSIFGAAYNSIRSEMQDFQKNAQAIASGSIKNGGSDYTDNMINMKQNQRSVEANSEVIKTGDEMIGRFIDTMA